jgi:hypothetical protein
MALLYLLRHQWMQQWRSVTWGRNLIANILLGLAGVYVGVTFLGLGWIYPQVVAEVAPSLDPLHLLNRHLLLAVLAVLVLRFFLQQPAGGDVQSYLALPIPTGRLAGHLQVVSGLSAFTLVPAVTLAAFGVSTVAPATDLGGTGCWGLGVLLAVVLTQGVNTLLRVAWDRHAGLVVGAAAVLVVGVATGNVLGVGGLRAASAGLFGGLSAGRLLPLAGLGVATALTMIAAHRALRARLYDVVEGTADASVRRRVLSGGHSGMSAVTSLALLGGKLLLRNKRPRQMFMNGLFLVGLLTMQMLVMLGPEGPWLFDAVFGLLAGYFGYVYGGFCFKWHGTYFDALLSRAVRAHTLVQSEFFLLVGLFGSWAVLVLPGAAALRPDLVAPIGAFFLYNVGVVAPALLGVGVWGRRAVQLHQGAFFNYQGNTSSHFIGSAVVLLPVVGLPFGVGFAIGPTPMLWCVTVLGLVGLATASLWTRWIGGLLQRHRHAMAAGFRNDS